MLRVSSFSFTEKNYFYLANVKWCSAKQLLSLLMLLLLKIQNNSRRRCRWLIVLCDLVSSNPFHSGSMCTPRIQTSTRHEFHRRQFGRSGAQSKIICFSASFAVLKDVVCSSYYVPYHMPKQYEQTFTVGVLSIQPGRFFSSSSNAANRLFSFSFLFPPSFMLVTEWALLPESVIELFLFRLPFFVVQKLH